MAKRAYRHPSQFRHLPQFRRFRRMLQFRMVAMTRWLNQTVRPSVVPIIFFSNTPTGYLQTRNLVDKVAAPLPVPPEIVKAIPDLVDAILKPLIGKDAPKAREEPLDAVKHLVPGKTLRAEGAVEAGANETSENSPSQGEATPPVAGSQDVPVAAPNPPAGCPSQPSPAATYGESGANLDPNPPAESPSPPAQSGSGGDVGGNPGANVGVSSSGDAGVSAGANAGCSG